MTAVPNRQVPPPVPYFGAKLTLAPQIVRLFPRHEHYVEPFCGSLAVLMAKPPSAAETANDLNRAVVTFWRVLRDRPHDLVRVCTLTPHARAEMGLLVGEDDLDDLEVARRLWAHLVQGRNGKTRDEQQKLSPASSWRIRIDVTKSASIQAQMDLSLDRMAAAAVRLRHVSLECLPALDIIARYGGHPDVLIYADPPYLGTTRTHNRYDLDMPDEAAHAELAAALTGCKAAVVLSGYRSPLYDRLYAGWHVHEIPTQTTQGATGQARCEVLWSNRPFGHGVQGRLL